MDTSLPNSLRSLIASGRLSKQSIEPRPSLLILRHSDRPALPPKSAGGELALTDAGKARARQLGTCLRDLGIAPGAVLMTTAMTRTAQTLLSICAGANWHDRIESIQVSIRAIGIGIIFERTIRIDEVLARFTSSGRHICHEFNEVAWGRIQVPGVKPCAEGARAQMRFLKDLLDRQAEETAPKGLSILLAHDWNLAYLLAHFFDMKDFTQETWPPFLDGILIQSKRDGEDETVTVTYGDKVIEIDLTEGDS